MKHLDTDNTGLVCLREFSGEFRIPDAVRVVDNVSHAVMGIVLDTETTGTGPNDTVIELALLPFFFDQRDGALLEVCDPFVQQQDPGRPLSEEIKEITGLRDEDVRGKSIDWERALRIMSNAHFITAYNAKFDRPLVNKAIVAAGRKPCGVPWVCAMVDIPWRKLPGKPPSLALGCVAAWHGFYFSAHRALADCKATLHLLDLAGQLPTLYRRSQQPSHVVLAHGSPFSTKDILKARGYDWDGTRKVWWTTVDDEAAVQAELRWLGDAVYSGSANTAATTTVAANARFL